MEYLFINLLGSENVLINESMSKHTTFKIGGSADIFITPPNAELLGKSAAICKEKNIPYTVIGNGSNLLVLDSGIRGVVISTEKMNNITVSETTLRAESGTLLSAAAKTALSNSLCGMEFAAGIPGSVGGGIVMNAGAYDGELKNIVSSVTALMPDGSLKIFDNQACCFDYRKSIFQENGAVIVNACFSLSPGSKDEILSKMNDFALRRRLKQPLEYPSAGSTFKRPKGYFAGKLIQDSGLAGFRLGGAQVSEKHCGFVINAGGATAEDVLNLIEHIKKTVYEKYGVTLNKEVKVLPECQQI